jgi:diguanylate cyclase (GGDEF)-like protein
LALRAGTGRFAGQPKIDGLLNAEKLAFVGQTLRQREIQIVEGSTALPLRIGDLTLGVIYLDRAAAHERDKELLHIFANQAAVAIHNAELHEMATLDHLTGVFNRGVFDQSTLRELRVAFRSQQPVGLLMVDMDSLKKINDQAGHPAGDQALMLAAKVLRRATRASDIIGRYGGDEFSITLPQTNESGAEQVGQRVVSLLEQSTLPCSDVTMEVSVSIGSCVLQPHDFALGMIPYPITQSYFEAMAQALVSAADAALYHAKNSGGKQVCRAPAIKWQPLPLESAAEA